MDCTGAPPNLWLKAWKYVCYLLNHTYNNNIDGILLEKLTGKQVDISTLLRFHWYQPVYYKMPLSSKAYPSKSQEQCGQIVGIAEDVGHNLTYCVLTDNTMHIIAPSKLCPIDPKAPNKHANLLSGEEIQPPNTFIKSHQQTLNISTKETNGETVEEAKQTDTAMPVF